MPSSPQETFFAELSEIKEKANEIYNSQGFLTDSDVKSVWSEEHFDHILSPNTLLGFPEDHSKDSKVSFLRLRFKILLTLIEIGWLQWNKCYPNLYSDKRNDEALPLARNDLNFLTPSLYDAFQKRQWRFNPPQLKEHGIVKKYDRGTKLPFMKASGETIGSGESGDVTRETVPAGYWKDHNGFLNTEPRVVARKLFKADHRHATSPPKPAKYENEVDNLQRFRKSRSAHRGIMDCLAYVLVEKKAGEELSIIMDEAHTNLQRYLPYEKATFLDNQTPTLRDLLTEAAGLAGAMDWLHEDIQITGEILACCHMDLNPRNILIFLENGSPVGIWKVADFGISAIRTPKQVLGKSDDNQAPQNTIETIVTKAKRYQGPYSAPELYDRREEVGRNSDIWSYGCILVDIIASKLTGEASLCSLTKSRRKKDEAGSHLSAKDDASSHSYDYFYRDKALNLYVRKWIDHLDQARGEKGDLESVNLSDCKKLLDEILVVEPHRPRAQDIRKRLINALKKIDTSEGASSSSMT